MELYKPTLSVMKGDAANAKNTKRLQRILLTVRVAWRHCSFVSWSCQPAQNLHFALTSNRWPRKLKLQLQSMTHQQSQKTDLNAIPVKLKLRPEAGSPNDPLAFLAA